MPSCVRASLASIPLCLLMFFSSATKDIMGSNRRRRLTVHATHAHGADPRQIGLPAGARAPAPAGARAPAVAPLLQLVSLVRPPRVMVPRLPCRAPALYWRRGPRFLAELTPCRLSSLFLSSQSKRTNPAQLPTASSVVVVVVVVAARGHVNM